jgi:hypothetical protein
MEKGGLVIILSLIYSFSWDTFKDINSSSNFRERNLVNISIIIIHVVENEKRLLY